jgi:hypothetical protein
MSQRTSKKGSSSNENILYQLNDYDRQRKAQTLIDDDHIQCVSADPVLKCLSVNTKSLFTSIYCID